MPPTAPSSTGSASGTPTCSAAARPSGCRATSTPGTAAGVRLRLRGPDERRSGRCWRRSRAAPTSGLPARTSRAGSPSRRCIAPPRTSRASRPDTSRSSPPRSSEFAHPALAHLERALFEESPPPQPELDAAVRFFEGAGTRGTLELVGEELLALIRSGTPPELIALVAPTLEPWRAPLEAVLGALGVPTSVESYTRLGSTPLGHALLQLLRYAWEDGGRRELFAYLRSPYSGLARSSVDFVEGRLRGRAIHTPARVEEETEKHREAPIPQLGELRGAATPTAGVRALVRSMLRAAYGTEAPPAGETSRLDLRTYDAVSRLLDELEAFGKIDGELSAHDVLAALERADVRLGSGNEAGRVAVLDLMRARTRRFEVVFVLGLEEGSLPRRTRVSPFLDDDARRALGGGSSVPIRSSRDRYLFYTACTRAMRRLYLVREAATDDGAPREPSPFWEEVAAVFDPEEVAHATSRRPLSALTWPLEAAPTDRERVRALAQLAALEPDAARALAARTAGSGASNVRALRSRSRHGSRTTSCWRGSARRRHSASRSSSASRTARRRGSSSASSRRRRSTRSSIRCCAGRLRTARCTSSTPACRRRSATTV